MKGLVVHSAPPVITSNKTCYRLFLWRGTVVSVAESVELNVRKQKLPSQPTWHYLCRSLSGRPVTPLWLFCWPYNGFLRTHATRRLAEIIFFSCLARLQLRNKLLMEARGRLLIIGASHPVDLFLYSLFLLRNSSVAVTGEKETICPVEDTQPAPSKPKPWHWMARSWLLATNTVISTGPKRDCLGLLIIYVCQFPHLLASCCLQLGFQTIRSWTCSRPRAVCREAAKHLKILNFICPLYNI